MIFINASYLSMHKYMIHLMTNYSLEMSDGTIARNYNSSLEKFKKSAYSFREKIRNDISLLEIKMRTINLSLV